jgi:hypothetical protein
LGVSDVARGELKAKTGASAVRKQDCFDVHRPIQDVQDGDAVSANAVEDQVSTVHPATDTMMSLGT